MRLQNKKIYFLILFLSSLSTIAQRALYVDNFNSILGNTENEERLLKFTRQHKFDKLILYELNLVNKRIPLADSSHNGILAKFIKEAKTKYNINQISASGENGDFFINVIDVYNKSRKDVNEKFDIYNLEYEYWHPTNNDLGGYYCENYLRKNGIPCNRNGSYKYYVETLSIMNLLADENDYPVKIEAYIGNYKSTEIENILENVDLLMISAFNRNPKKSYKDVEKRLKIIEDSKKDTKISIIFSSETEYMGGYLKYNSIRKTEKEFLEFAKDINVNLFGFTYFQYSYLEESVNYEVFRRTGKRPSSF